MANSGQFQAGQSGNPAGKRAGTRNRASLAVEALLDGEAEALTRRAIEMALEGDGPAMRLCLERLCPPRKDRPVTFDLPPIETAADLTKATAAIVRAVAAGEISPAEAQDVAGVLELHRRALDMSDLVTRVAALEAAQPNRSA
ncbi:DUF5681 domain-containing protein [Methylobacterium sp. J-067]|uniref:DUF5681 domain-containing protein n=1 Tax=Methylobacterium sp. J-067 TaxID=2836648 RepID=UPI001FBBEC07|nr:DUF5681 domain-containing protein [Methylobacterium sp. J-067]MCJ2025163.1 DUF5681 domain-containing protein [Methylobacterium sp. J-067]